MESAFNLTKLSLFDDFWIDFRPGTIRRWYSPHIVGSYRDTDFMNSTYTSAFYDPNVGKYRMYYEVTPDPAVDEVRYLALALSDDGIHYEPTKVNDHPEKRMQRIVFDGGSGLHGTGVMYDPFDPDPSRRYKCATMSDTGNYRKSKQPMPVITCFSADGIRWEEHKEMVMHPYTSDALNCLFYNPYTQEYCLVLRAAFVDRRICMRTSKDFIHWSDPVMLLHPGPSYNDNITQTQFYSMWAGFMDGMFLGLLWDFTTSMVDMDFDKMWGCMDTELVYSYDGRNFMQTTGKHVLERPAAPEYGSSQLYLMGLMESRDKDKYILYGAGQKFPHGTPTANRRYTDMMGGDASAIVLSEIRKDGFCGLEGLRDGSLIITKPIELLKDDLSYNINASAGFARFGIRRKDGSYYEGFEPDNCTVFTGDSVNIKPQWSGVNLASLLGQQLRLEVELNNATLHAITMTARPCIMASQVGFHNPAQIITSMEGNHYSNLSSLGQNEK